MKRMESRKSHSWWWDSHICPKNSKRLSENLEEMDHIVKQMLKLIEEDGDSFAQKAEMYYKKRPELISLVEELYRGYRSLAERYDLQSQASDNGSEASSTWPSPSPRKVGRRISSNRAAGFDFFLGSGGNGYDACQKDGDGSSTLTDSDDESDTSSINSYSGLFGHGGDHGTNRRVMELEMELREIKEKLCMHEEERADELSKGARIENSEDLHAKISAYEHELRNLNDKLRLSEEEITNLKIELEKYRSTESANLQAGIELSSTEEDVNTLGEALDHKTLVLQGSICGMDKETNESLGEELRITKEKLESSEMQIATMKFEASKSSESVQQLQDQLNLAMKDIAAWKTKYNSEKRESTKLQEKLMKLKTSLADRDHEIRDLKSAVSDAEQKIYLEKAYLKSEMSNLLGKQAHLEEQIGEWESHGQSLEEEIRKIQSEKIKMEETLKGEIELLKEDIKDRKKNIKDLNVSLDDLKLERQNPNAGVGSLKEEVNSRDNQIEHLDMHLNQLHMQHVQLIVVMEEAHRQVEELKSRVKQLEEENERQRTKILEGAEEKREAIRQLCFSLEHYRNGYNVLRQAFIGHKRFPLLAT